MLYVKLKANDQRLKTPIAPWHTFCFLRCIIMQAHGHIEAASAGRTVTEHASPGRTATEHVSPDGTATEHASTSASTHDTPLAAGSYTEEAAVGCDMSIICVSDQETLVRPCVDCGQRTGRFCDYCYAADRCPDERWAPNQMTPLCTRCDNTHDKCHFCRGQAWCVPPASRPSR